VLVQVINQVHKIFGAAITARRRIISCRCKAKAVVIGILHDRQKLHMGVAHLTDIRGKLPGKLTVIQEFAALFTGPSPCPGMKLVDGHRERLRIKLRAFLHPGSIPPGVGGKIYRDGSSIRTFFTGKTIGIALEKCKA
jgi:hypothetical protein